jgi:phosphoribosylformylglycinamidine synthase subunit PurL
LIDSVSEAKRSPEIEQPFAELGLKLDEYESIKKILSRRPTNSELAMYSVMWSEHCSYKSSKIHLKQFGEKTPTNTALMVGIGENAGVVDIGQGWAATFKVESHNHPSYIEPYQGAATGVGGIVRDILSMGARPIAVMDSLRFGPLNEPDTKRVLPQVVAGVGGYGNCLGLPNIGGETKFDPTYLGNPLVNALSVGVMKHEDIHLAKADGVGHKVVLYGAKTGGDGIGGVSVLASETFSDSGPTKRPSVQVGDPFMEKLLIEATLEMFSENIVEGIQDLGGAGISCATSELASNGTGGMSVELDKVPLRDSSLSPEEILMSESQERMCAIVKPENIDKFMQICEKWEITATVIGEVTNSDRLIITWHGEVIVDVPPRTVAHDGPVYQRPFKKSQKQTELEQNHFSPEPSTNEEIKNHLIKLLSSEGICDPSWVTNQYDRYVRGNTVSATPSNAGVLRVDEKSNLGISLSLVGNGRFCQLNPYLGTQLNLAESYRKVALSGAKPIAVTNCLNFGSPEDEAVMWQFERSVTALADATLEMNIPVTGGNVSFYNQTGEVAILPTPVIGVLGTIQDVTKRVTNKFQKPNLAIYLIGETKPELDGSAFAWFIHQHLGGTPPEINLTQEVKLADFLLDASQSNLITASQNIGEGGLLTTLAKSALISNIGLKVNLEDSSIQYLFSESATRALLFTSKPTELETLLTKHQIQFSKIGSTVEDNSLTVENLLDVSLDELRNSFENQYSKQLNV